MCLDMRPIHADKAPKAIGPYSQAVVAGNLVFCSGQIALEPSGAMVDWGIKEQTVQVFKNLEEVLRAAGIGLDSVASVSVFLRDMNDFKEKKKIKKKTFNPEPGGGGARASAKRRPRNSFAIPFRPISPFRRKDLSQARRFADSSLIQIARRL